MIDYRMETFLTLCEQLNYRKTADILHISQPAVTQQIQFLEREYGCKLFSYESRRLTKTEAGQMLEEYARAMRHQDQALRQRLAGSNTRELKIGATKTIGDYVITEQIHRYLSDPSNALTLIVDNTEHLLALLEQDELDFAVIEGYFDKDRFDSRLYRREPFVGICRKDHPFAGREVTIPELLQQTIIHREAGSGTRAILEQKLKGYNESLSRFKRHICISSFKMILELVKADFGVSFVYKVLAESDPEISTFRIQGEPIVREFNIVYLKHTDQREKIRWFFGKNRDNELAIRSPDAVK